MNDRSLNKKNKSQIQENYEKKLRVHLFKTASYLVICIICFTVSIDVKADVLGGAAVGGFMGLILGDDIDDVAAGAVVGAGVGAVSSSMKKKEAEITKNPRVIGRGSKTLLATKINKESIFFTISIYPNLFDDLYYKDIIIKHFLPFLNKKIVKILKEKGANKALYFKYPQKMIDSGNLNPIFPLY